MSHRRKAPRSGRQTGAVMRDQTPPADLFAALNATRKETVELRHKLAKHTEMTTDLATAISRHEHSLHRLLRGLLPALDTFDRLLAAGPDVEIESYQASLRKAVYFITESLSDNGIELIGKTGEIADPDTHQIIETATVPGVPEDTVLSVIQRGVRYQGKLVRPAAVVTAVGQAAQEAATAGAVACSIKEES